MSYNYLPLDRKHTNFQQIKNLLAYDQLVSITFDAHVRILKCREYLDEKMKEKDAVFVELIQILIFKKVENLIHVLTNCIVAFNLKNNRQLNNFCNKHLLDLH